jgi:hypothetical protein
MATLRRDIRQGALEAFEADYSDRLVLDDEGVSTLRGQQTFFGATVRAAAAAGWFTNLDADGVDGLTAKEIRKLHIEVNALYTELTAIDPNS